NMDWKIIIEIIMGIIMEIMHLYGLLGEIIMTLYNDDWNSFQFGAPPKRKLGAVITELEDEPPPPRRKSGGVIRELDDDPLLRAKVK
ncbi:hypothetical protein TorRG33x02_148440, partial [Trema orientale]